MPDGGHLFVQHLSEAAVVKSSSLSFEMSPKDDKKIGARKSAKKDKDLVNKSGGKAKKK